ncbi:MAG: hypothetical protein EXR07_05985 [Acetobacteraceae bacterium]|nr:hypothetical protein [Acetobacteraceae bacterium]
MVAGSEKIRLPWLACAAVMMFVASPIAAETTVRVGDLMFAYDGDRWRGIHISPDRIEFQPIGPRGEDRRRALVAREKMDSHDACQVAASNLLSPELYETPVAGAATKLGGLGAIIFSAHTRCRNATPAGVVICAVHKGFAYGVGTRQIGCRDGSAPFSGQEWLGEFVKGATFTP